MVREDVGRHNAMDKVIGQALLDGELPLADRVLCVSGRLAFELVQKAVVAGAPVLVGVGRPDLAGGRAGRGPRADARAASRGARASTSTRATSESPERASAAAQAKRASP